MNIFMNPYNYPFFTNPYSMLNPMMEYMNNHCLNSQANGINGMGAVNSNPNLNPNYCFLPQGAGL
jgi:hypothetical protein